ncbi:reverse transcriptase domain-containing protein [Tanacetum coccineum]|uniref:Reverse transcriptase domain-containing protein n=1 Tax=Tanacetum coccineum TaxID=301880 RepID=A0ABQ4ZB18_9ASTR
MDDFNTGTTQGYRTRHMLTGKWIRINGDCQNFKAIYKHLERKSGENKADHIKAAKITFAAQQPKGRKFQLEHCWRILKGHSKWDASKPLDMEDHSEIFGPDARPRPAGKTQPAKKTKFETTGSSGGSVSGSLYDYVSEDLRRKLQAETSAYEAKKAKEMAMIEFKEIEFLTIDADSLPEPKASIIRNRQEKIIAKYTQHWLLEETICGGGLASGGVCYQYEGDGEKEGYVQTRVGVMVMMMVVTAAAAEGGEGRNDAEWREAWDQGGLTTTERTLGWGGRGDDGGVGRLMEELLKERVAWWVASVWRRWLKRLDHDGGLVGFVVAVRGLWWWWFIWVMRRARCDDNEGMSTKGRAVGDLVELESLISNVSLRQNCSDGWKFDLDTKGEISVKLLNKKALKRRIPVRMELDKKGIDMNSILCLWCDNSIESINHTLVLCENAMKIWNMVFAWWGIGPFNVFTSKEILKHNRGVAVNKGAKKLWNAVIAETAYFIWKNRNVRVFKGKGKRITSIFKEIQLRSFEWSFRRSKKYVFRWEQWLERPSMCGMSTGQIA